jgi:uncharacterized membrane protein
MITESTIYWVTRLDAFNNLVTAVSFISVIFLIASIIASCVVMGERNSMLNIDDKLILPIKFVIGSIIILVICATLLVFVPTTKEYAAMKILPKIANDEALNTLSQDGKELYRLTVDYLKEQVTVRKEN